MASNGLSDSIIVSRTIDFDIFEEICDSKIRQKFWNNLQPWFLARGYRLHPHYGLVSLNPHELQLYDIADNPVDPSSLYSHVASKEACSRFLYPPQFYLNAATSNLRRDVMIKFFPTESNERTISEYLKDERHRLDPLNRTISVLDVFTLDSRLSFSIMPRWGPAAFVKYDGFDTVGTALHYADCLLKALAFLHKNMIVHRDLRPANVLVNFYDYGETHPETCRAFFATGQARFVLCDFGLSHMFPPDTPPELRLRPAEESEWGTYEYHLADLESGDSMYDPFAYDVGCLGGLLCEIIGYLTPLVPPLAPFLDRMIGPDIPSRISASDAVRDFNRLIEQMDASSMQMCAISPPKWTFDYVWQGHDRWADLPESFIREVNKAPVRPRRKIQGPQGSYFVDWNATDFV
ncbi:hypothetical protein QCA50_012444 [Cerrena zonata]|uniref:Protein kinase domain-containing protein n=1 Tax=Cerrena zonata TaxID=2478898 RepID=A0AAW0FYT7_9APHY